MLVSLAGYFIATLASFYSNMEQYDRLSHLEETWFPLATLGSDMLHTFKAQIDRHEEAFLTGEEELAEEITALNFVLLDKFTKTAELIRKKPQIPVKIADIERLRLDYLAYLKLAKEIDTWADDAIELTPKLQKEIQQHGRQQRDLLERFTALDKNFSTCFIQEIQRNKVKTLHTTFFLGILFLLVLLFATIIIDKVAERLLVKPLATIKDNVRRFAAAQEIVEPPATGPSDEVGLLASAFWDMTRDLKATTVSKKYVDNIIRNMSGALVVLSPEGLIQKINQQATVLFDYEEKELLDQPASLLFVDAKEDPIGNLGRLGDWPLKNIEVNCRAKDGRIFPAHFSGSVMDTEAGKVVGLVCVLNDITELKSSEQKLKQMALHDPLTGLANRHLFFDRLDLASHEAERSGGKFALLFLDLDKFKPVNDTLGHDIGDLVLKNVATRLQNLVRAGDTVARMGGDEFTIILNGLHTDQDAEKIAEKIIQRIAVPFTFGNISCSLGVSIGITLYPDHGTHVEQLINKADQAMYLAKAKGRNTYCLHQERPSSQRDQPKKS